MRRKSLRDVVRSVATGAAAGARRLSTRLGLGAARETTVADKGAAAVRLEEVEMAKRLYRSTSDRMLSGVCGGLGKYLDVDPTMVRLLTVVIAIATGGLAVVITYVVAGCIVPEDTERDPRGEV